MSSRVTGEFVLFVLYFVQFENNSLLITRGKKINILNSNSRRTGQKLYDFSEFSATFQSFSVLEEKKVRFERPKN